MNAHVDDFDRSRERKDRFHPDYESFSEWLNAVAPDTNTDIKARNSRWPGINRQVQLREIAKPS